MVYSSSWLINVDSGSCCRNAHVAESLDRFALGEILKLEQLADFDLAILMMRIGEAAGPFEGLLARFHLDDGVAGDELLRLGERPVDEPAPAALIFDAPACGRGMETIGIEQHPRLGEFLMIVRHGGEKVLARHNAPLRVLRRLDDDHESHKFSPCSCDFAAMGYRATTNGGLRNRQRFRKNS